MRTFATRILRRSAVELLAAGAGTITLDHRLRRPRLKSQREALAGDWQAVGNDLKWAIDQIEGEREVA